MNKNDDEMSNLFTHQINTIASTLLSLSLTLIPVLIFAMFFFRKQFIKHVLGRLECSENIYKHIEWNILC